MESKRHLKGQTWYFEACANMQSWLSEIQPLIALITKKNLGTVMFNVNKHFKHGCMSLSLFVGTCPHIFIKILLS